MASLALFQCSFHERSSFRNPEARAHLTRRVLHASMHHPLVSILNDQNRHRIRSFQDDGMLCVVRYGCVSNSSTSSNQTVVVDERSQRLQPAAVGKNVTCLDALHLFSVEKSLPLFYDESFRCFYLISLESTITDSINGCLLFPDVVQKSKHPRDSTPIPLPRREPIWIWKRPLCLGDRREELSRYLHFWV